jgi:transcription elongation factor GreA
MSKEPYFVTPQGLETLRDRLRRLKEVDRARNMKEIEEARAHGDISENAEFHAAKERQGLLDLDIRTIEDKLARARVIDPRTLSGEKVVFGATVVLLNVDTDERVTWTIVGEDESDLKQARISYRSPLAKALIHKREGDEVEVEAPGGTRTYEIVEVRFG